ncbi:hypothetical protein J6590_026278 [Homalodisca vitripennis]|nr:hypothetical protein J6590_026278 [Homalodisca vitripennis]
MHYRHWLVKTTNRTIVNRVAHRAITQNREVRLDWRPGQYCRLELKTAVAPAAKSWRIWNRNLIHNGGVNLHS